MTLAGLPRTTLRWVCLTVQALNPRSEAWFQLVPLLWITGGRNGDKSISATRGKAESTQAFTLLSRSRERMRAVDNPRGPGRYGENRWRPVASHWPLYVDYELTFLRRCFVNRCRYAHAVDERRQKIYLSM